jgi:pSer/pThr/pTyr-binding forkhead associated (FHA) protein
MRALEKDVKDRYDTAKEMGEAVGYKEAVELPTTSVKPLRPTLRVMQGSRKGQRIPLAEESLALGRLDFDASDTSISRRHVNIIYRGGGYWLHDLSKNGTWVDNQRVYGEIPLRTGAMIMFGENVLRLEMGQQSP